jgi:hypothetical protein
MSYTNQKAVYLLNIGTNVFFKEFYNVVKVANILREFIQIWL